MTSPTPTLSVANYFIGKSIAEGRPITPMKLLKLVYIAHGWYLGNFNAALINDAVEAWKYGPVIPYVYHQFKGYGSSSIEAQATALAKAADSGTAPQYEFIVPTVNEESTKTFLDAVWKNYGGYSGTQLSAMTHRAGTPWDEIWRKHHGSEYRGAVIPNELIRDHYKKLLDERRADSGNNAA